MNDLKKEIYEHLSTYELGKENGTSRAAIAGLFGLSVRDLRRITNEINSDASFDKLISTTGNIYVCNTKEECEKSIKTTYKSAIALFKKARAMEKKMGLNNQIRLSGKDLIYDIIEVFKGD